MEKVLLVGLGNPGEKFLHTPHNMGIELLQWWVGEYMPGGKNGWGTQAGLPAEIITGEYNGVPLVAAFPLTFMNDSGKAVATTAHYLKVSEQRILIIHDEIELPAGEVQLDIQGGPARGHNGVRSVHDELKSDAVPRLRIGVGHPPAHMPVKQFVLQALPESEYQAILHDVKAKVAQAIESFIQTILPTARRRQG